MICRPARRGWGDGAAFRGRGCAPTFRNGGRHGQSPNPVEVIAVAELNRLIHEPSRLRLMAALTAVEADAEVDFVHLRKVLQMTDGNLGSHLLKLEEAGYVRLEKTFEHRKPRTFVRLTRRGRSAFEEHVTALRESLSLGGD